VWSAGWDNSIYIWDAEDFGLKFTLSGHKEVINSMIVVPMLVPVVSVNRAKSGQVLEQGPPTAPEAASTRFFGFLFSSANTTPVASPSRPSTQPAPSETVIQNFPIECTVYSVWSSSWDGTMIMWL